MTKGWIISSRTKIANRFNIVFHFFQASLDEAFRNEASISDLFTVKSNLKALIYTCLLVSFQQLSGINVVLFYMESIFISAGSTLETSISTIIVGSVQVLASCVTPLVVDRLGRRILLVFSGIGEIVTLVSRILQSSLLIRNFELWSSV